MQYTLDNYRLSDNTVTLGNDGGRIDVYKRQGEGLGFVLVGENDVHVVADQTAQEFEILGHDVEAGQILSLIHIYRRSRRCFLSGRVW